MGEKHWQIPKLNSKISILNTWDGIRGNVTMILRQSFDPNPPRTAIKIDLGAPEHTVKGGKE